MMSEKTTVFLVDDDEAVRDALSLLLESVDLPVKAYDSGLSFLEAFNPDEPGVLVLDIRMPGMSGLELQDKLKEMECDVPIVFITGHGDIPMAVEAMRKGAVDFLAKPFRDQDLLDRINRAMRQEETNRESRANKQEIQSLFERLTPRENEVMERVVQGLANKAIAYELDVSQRTVEIHRARVMEKLGVRSVAQLVRLFVASQA